MKNTVKIYDDFFKVAIHYVTMLIFASNTSKIKHVHITMKTNGFCCKSFSAVGALACTETKAHA